MGDPGGRDCGRRPVAGVEERLLRTGPDPGPALGGSVTRVERAEWLQRLFFIRACRVLGTRRLHGGAGDDLPQPDAVADHSSQRRRRQLRRRADRLPDLSPARPLFRTRDARLSTGNSLCLPVARLSRTDPADEAGSGLGFYAVRQSARLCRARARFVGGDPADLAEGREFALRHGAVGDKAERAGSRGGWHQHLALEDAGADVERRAWLRLRVGYTQSCCWC